MKRTVALYLVLTCAAMLPLVAGAAPVIANGSFEMDDTIAGLTLPLGFGDWEGDRAFIVAAEQEISPFDGQRMLRFLSAQGVGGTPDVADVVQLLDVSSVAGLIASGNGGLVASAFYNRVLSDDRTDTQFGMTLQAFSGSPDRYATATPLASRSIWEIADENVSTWEEITVSMALPVGTTYVAVIAQAMENILVDDFLHGHYVDVISVRVVPLPPALLLFAGAFLGLIPLQLRHRGD